MKSNSDLSFFDTNVIYLDQIDSTNLFLKSQLKSLPSQKFHAVYAGYQSQGHGQRARIWESSPNQNLLMSIAFRPEKFLISNLNLLTIAIPLIIRDAIHSYIMANTKELSVEIKWPNDIIIQNKKIAGILIENSLSHTYVEYIIVGIGINIHQIEFKNSQATSLASIDSSIKWCREDLLQSILKKLELFIIQLESKTDIFTEEYHQYMYKIHQKINCRYQGVPMECMVMGIDQDANLLLKKMDGDILKLNSTLDFEWNYEL